MTLKSVVLPAPFGPITPTMRPGSTSRLTASSAVSPSKWTCTPSTRSSPGPSDAAAERAPGASEPGAKAISTLSGGTASSLGERLYLPPDCYARLREARVRRQARGRRAVLAGRVACVRVEVAADPQPAFAARPDPRLEVERTLDRPRRDQGAATAFGADGHG